MTQQSSVYPSVRKQPLKKAVPPWHPQRQKPFWSTPLLWFYFTVITLADTWLAWFLPIFNNASDPTLQVLPSAGRLPWSLCRWSWAARMFASCAKMLTSPWPLSTSQKEGSVTVGNAAQPWSWCWKITRWEVLVSAVGDAWDMQRMC